MHKNRVQVTVVMSLLALVFAFFGHMSALHEVPKVMHLATVCYDSSSGLFIECANLSSTNEATDVDIVTETETETETESIFETGNETESCPFPNKVNRTIVDFTGYGTKPLSGIAVRADETYSDASNSTYTNLQPGIYAVHLASRHQVLDGNVSATYNERWRVELSDSNNEKVLQTLPTRSVERDELYVEETVESSITVPKNAVKVLALHNAYPSTEPYTFAPLCAAFDFLSVLPLEAIEQNETETYEVETEDVSEENPTLIANDSDIYTFVHCPFESKEGRVIVDYTHGGKVPIANLRLSADTTTGLKSVSTPESVSIEKGTYKVTLASYGHNLNTVDADAQEWFIRLTTVSGLSVGQSLNISDVPKNTEGVYTQTVSNEMTVAQKSALAYAHHRWQLPGKPNVVAPICAAFDIVSSSVSTEWQSLSTSPVIVPSTIAPTTRDVFTSYSSGTGSVDIVSAGGPIDIPVVMTVTTTFSEMGLGDKSGELQVPENVIENRIKIIERLQSKPFTALQSTSSDARKQIVREFIAVHVENGADVEAIEKVLRRTSVEDDAESLQQDTKHVFEAFRYNERSALDTTYVDTDGDGVTDYDELYIYKTNPENPFTGGDMLSDGERIMLGLNPSDTSLEPVKVQSPKNSGKVSSELFTVDEIHLTKESAGDLAVVPKERIRVRGKAQPLSFVTLYVYSTPVIVTVRADEEGKYEYEFDETLENGDHELYVASVNTSGKILAKSDPVPFVKTAQAIEYTPVVHAEESNPVDTSIRTMVTFAFILTILLIIGVVIWIGIYKSQHTKEDDLDEFHETE